AVGPGGTGLASVAPGGQPWPSSVLDTPSLPCHNCRCCRREGSAGGWGLAGHGNKGSLPRGLQASGAGLEFRVFPSARTFRGQLTSPRGSGVEHFLGKEGVTGSNPVVGSIAFL